MSVPATGAAVPIVRGLARASASFAVVADVAMATLGGALKRAESLSGRLADAMAWMYIATATVNRERAEVMPEAAFRWATAEALWRIDDALHGVIANLPNRAAAAVLRVLVFPFGVRTRPPDDRLTAAAGRCLIDGAATRLELTPDMFVPGARELGLGRLEHALELVVAAQPVNARLRDAVRTGALVGGIGLLDRAVAAGVITTAELHLIAEAEAAREDAVQVDAFPPSAFAAHEVGAVTAMAAARSWRAPD